jgi:hypothetical protein
VLLLATRFELQFTHKPLSMSALGGDAVAWEGAGDIDILFEAIGEGDDAMHVDGGSG